MACILTLMGSVLGFVLATAALVLFQVPFVVALAVWVGAGVACVALGLALALSTKPEDAEVGAQELA